MNAAARRLLDETRWDALNHAYGPATEALEALGSLLSPDEDARAGGLDYLYGSILHQGTAYTATPPACLYLCALLADVDAGLDGALRPDLVGVLSDVAEIVADAGPRRPLLEALASFDVRPFVDALDRGPDGQDETAALSRNERLRPYLDAYRALHPEILERFRLDPRMLLHFIGAAARDAVGALACLPIAPDLGASLDALVDDPDARTRVAAARGAARLAAAGPEPDRRADLARKLRAMAERAATSDERAALVMSLGDLGADTTAFFRDPAPGVRLCAAMAPRLAADAEAFALMRTMVEQHATRIGSWFVDRPAQFQNAPRVAVVERLVGTARSFDDLVEAAVVLARVPPAGEVRLAEAEPGGAATLAGALERLAAPAPVEPGLRVAEWGPLLALAFPDGDGAVRTEAQRRFLAALAARPELWARENGQARRCLEAAGLPHDREACAGLAGHR